MKTICDDQGSRKNTNLTFGGSVNDEEGSETASFIMKQEGEALLRAYKRRFAQEVFDKNIFFSFESIFEAGYLSKYKSIIWQQLSDDGSKSEREDKSGNWSYDQRKTSFRLTKAKSSSRYHSVTNLHEDDEVRNTGVFPDIDEKAK